MKSSKDLVANAKNKIDSVDFDVHWYRRVFHTFAASLLVYYMLPDIYWIETLKFWVPIFLLFFVFILEILRLKGFVSSNHFFGLRYYEKKRIGSYVFFGAGIFILLLFFPQQIAIPCILCASIADPVMGEIRNNFKGKQAVVIGFILCMFFFAIVFYKSSLWIMLLFSFVGASGAVFGEIKKFRWLDDDFLIQIIPAVLLITLWFLLKNLDIIVDFKNILGVD